MRPLSHHVLFSHSQMYDGGRQFITASLKSPSYNLQDRKFQLQLLRFSVGICSNCTAAVPTCCPRRTKPSQIPLCSTQHWDSPQLPGPGTPGQRAHGSTWERPDVWPAVSFQQQRALLRDPFVPSILTRWGDRIWEISSREGVCSCSKTTFVKCPEQMRKAVLVFQWQSLSEAAVKLCGKKEAATLGKWQFKTHGYLADESCHVQGSLWLWMLQDVLLNGVCFKDRQVSAPSETALCLGYVLNVITSVIYSFLSFNVCER